MSPSRRVVSTCLCAFSLLSAAAVAAAPSFEQRLERADSLLAESAGWDRAIALYRELLAEAPDRDDVRLRLGQVLAWGEHHPEALVELDRVLTHVPQHAAALLTRAQVLSWSGDYDAAEVAFLAILAEHPDDPEARIGLARVYSWSGRSGRAKTHYDRALRLADDPEVRAERDALPRGPAPWLQADASYFDDESDFTRYENSASAAFYLDRDTRLFARTRLIRLRQHLVGPGAPTSNWDRAWDVSLGGWRQISKKWSGAAELGFRTWRHARDRAYASGKLEFALSEAASLQLSVAREDHLDHSDARRALVDDVRGTYTSLGGWVQLAPRWDGFAQVQGAWLSDDNRFFSSYAEFGYQLHPGQGGHGGHSPYRTRLSLGANLLRYQGNRSAYYSPDLDTGVSLSLAQSFEFGRRWTLDLQAAGGAGFTRETGLRSSGAQWSVQAGAAWTPGPWRLHLNSSYQRSQRASKYTAVRVELGLRREF